MGMLLSWVAGLGLAAVAPRWRFLVLGLATFAAVLVVVLGIAGFDHFSVLLTALIALILFGLAALLVEQRPRAAVAGVTTVFVLGSAVALFEKPPSSVRWVAGGVMTLVVLLAWRRPRVALRLGCAALGARLCLGFASPLGGPWGWLGLTAALFVVNAYTTPMGWREPPPLKKTKAHAVAFVPVLLLLLVPLLARPLPLGTEGARLAKLKGVLGAGGYLWPMPTEALTWDDAGAYRFYDNLDARYLTGTHRRSFFRLPGTHVFHGAFIANGEVSKLRGIKDPGEVADLSLAAKAIVAAVKDVLPRVKAGTTERELADAIELAAKAHGCEALSFPSVVASGPHGAEPHARVTDRALQDGELVVVDVGCDHHHYASDFTRTLPVGGKFTAETRAIYSAVYDAQQAALRDCKAGIPLHGGPKKTQAGQTLDAKAHAVLVERLHERGYEHALGHPVGLFVHDVGGQMGKLEVGNIITLEPGDYRRGVLGVRIEDTFRVNESSCELLTEGFPADADSVEGLMASGTAIPSL